jgi:fructosamine-3-kinase
VNVAGVELADAVPVAGGDMCRAWSATTADRRRVFAKSYAGAPADFFAAEARGLDRLRLPGGPPVPQVLAVDATGLVLDWVEPGRPEVAVAVDLGRRLAVMHAHDPGTFGADGDGFIGSLPLDNRPAADWPTFYATRRLAPYLDGVDPDTRRDVGRLLERIDELAGPAEPPALVHGDLWSGNVVWGAGRQAWLVDAAAAHGGHRETDLAMLALFGCPFLDEVRAGYEEVRPLAAGWQQRVALHQLHPLLVHARLFGGGYVGRVRAAVHSALRAG